MKKNLLPITDGKKHLNWKASLADSEIMTILLLFHSITNLRVNLVAVLGTYCFFENKPEALQDWHYSKTYPELRSTFIQNVAGERIIIIDGKHEPIVETGHVETKIEGEFDLPFKSVFTFRIDSKVTMGILPTGLTKAFRCLLLLHPQ